MSRNALPDRLSHLHPYGVIDVGYNTGQLAAWRFGKEVGMSDADAYKACVPNKSPNRAYAGPQSAMLLGAPVVQTDYWEFASDGAAVRCGLKKPQIFEPNEWAIIITMKTDQNPINSNATRPFAAGWYAQNDGQGSGLWCNSTTVYRAITYASAGSSTTLDLSVAGGSPADVTRWRCLALQRWAGNFVLESLTADGTTDEDTGAPATFYPGGRPFTIGSPYNIFTGGAIMQIRDVLVYELSGAPISDPNLATILASLRAAAAGTAAAAI